MEDDIFFEHEAERAISNNEMDRLRDSFTTVISIESTMMLTLL